MARIEKRKSSFLLVAFEGYNQNGKQIRKTKTWKPPAGMSPKKAEKEAMKAAVLFEQQVQAGQIADGKGVKFSEFAERWFTDYAEVQLRPRTVARYKELMNRINPAIGHMRIDKIRPAHLMDFYKQLSALQESSKFQYIGDLKAVLRSKNITKKAFAEQAGVSIGVLNSITQGKNISKDSARKVADGLGIPLAQCFEPAEGKTLSSKTILHYHRLISSIMQTAVYWQVIVANPCDRVQPPKVQKTDIEYLDHEQAIRLLELIQDEPIQFKTAVIVLLFTGMRRGELLGLKWSDVDFSNSVISICRSSLYLAERGVFEDGTKNRTSNRVIKVPASVIQALRQYRAWQSEQRLRLGVGWQGGEYIFTSIDGKPMHPDTLSGWFHRFIQTTDLPQIHLHSLRHTNATLSIANGIAVTTIAGQLGHANANTTTKIYAHQIQSAQAAAADAMENLLNPEKQTAHA